jgi:hypothetical protein
MWTARPADPEQPLAFPGLRTDARDIVVASQGLVWIAQKAENQATSAFVRLGRFLLAASEVMPLPAHVSVRETAAGDIAVSLTPPDPEADDLSRIYDSLASAAATSGSRLYVGAPPTFIEYRDGKAPRGYDERNVQPTEEHALYLVGREGTTTIARGDLTEMPLADVLLRLGPQAGPAGMPPAGIRPAGERPARAFVVAARPLYGMLSRYFRDHRIVYRVGQFHVPDLGIVNIFEIARSEAAPGTTVPSFVLSYLASLPRCVVLTEVEHAEERRMLVQWQHRPPGIPRHIREAFPPDSLILFIADSDYPSLRLTPAPTLFDSNHVLATEASSSHRTVALLRADEPVPLRLPVTLVPERLANPSIAAVILTPRELRWVRGLMLRWPARLFQAYAICIGTECSVLMTESTTIELLPIGVPLRRVQDSQLFIPVDSRLSSELSADLLTRTFDLKADHLTFLTHQSRVDVPRGAFVPLSTTLFAAPERPRVALTLEPTRDLPPLAWEPPEKPPAQAPAGRHAPEQTQSSGSGPAAGQWSASTASPPAAGGLRSALTWWRRPTTPPLPPPRLLDVVSPGPAPGAERLSEEDLKVRMRTQLLDQAAAFRLNNDLLKAAVCFELAGSPADAARCYEALARSFKRVQDAEGTVR